mmetsp:Transcript_49921/g.125777  ORF Transcript_49921/g.125777 Transcript_49921/m.125777 type:complete len:206 (+) Transcript_49921:660-1277(+)
MVTSAQSALTALVGPARQSLSFSVSLLLRQTTRQFIDRCQGVEVVLTDASLKSDHLVFQISPVVGCGIDNRTIFICGSDHPHFAPFPQRLPLDVTSRSVLHLGSCADPHVKAYFLRGKDRDAIRCSIRPILQGAWVRRELCGVVIVGNRLTRSEVHRFLGRGIHTLAPIRVSIHQRCPQLCMGSALVRDATEGVFWCIVEGQLLL